MLQEFAPKGSVIETIPAEPFLSTDKKAKPPVYSRLEFLVFGLVIILFVSLRLWHLNSYSLGGGEVFTMLGIYQTWTGMFHYIIQDVVHPPLFYILLKLWIALGGESLLWVKLLPAVTAIASLVPLILIGRQLRLTIKDMNLAILLVAVNGFLVHFAQEVRMYSLLMFIALCSFCLFIKFIQAEESKLRNHLFLFLVNLALIYTHYFGWFVIAVEVIILFFFAISKLRKFIFGVASLILCFLPWGYVVAQAALRKGGLDENLDWIPKPRLSNIVHLLGSFNGTFEFRGSNTVSVILFAAPIIVWGWRIIRPRNEEARLSRTVFCWLASICFLPIIAAFIFSFVLKQAIWIERYFIFIAPLYLIFVVASLKQLRPFWIKSTVTVLILVWSALAGIHAVATDKLAWEGAQVGSRIPWESVTRQLIDREVDQTNEVKIYALTSSSDGIQSGYWTIATSIEFYLGRLNDKRFKITSTRTVSTLLGVEPENHFWVACFVLDDRLPLPRQSLTEKGYQVGEEIRVSGADGKAFLLFPVQKPKS